MSDRAEYRSGVGLVLINRQGLIFMGRRRDNRENPWQLPQGGLEPDEPCEQAVFREMREELGTDHALIADSRTDWLKYDYPRPDMSPRARRFKGQQHRWFLLHYLGKDEDIDLNTAHPEFSQWRWTPPALVSGQAISFKQDVYRQVISGFAYAFQRHHLADDAETSLLQTLSLDCSSS